MMSFRKSFQKKIFSIIICLCMICGLVWVAQITANADTVPEGFSFNVRLADSNTYRYYDGGDTDPLGVSSMNSGLGSYSGGTITATNAGNSSTIYLKESKNFKNAEYILVPFTMSVEVPAYTAYTVNTKIQLSMNRNAKGSSWYVFEWADNTNNAAYGKSFSTKMDLTTTDGFVYRAYGNDKTYNPTEEGTLVFDNREGSTATTITRQYAIFVGNSRSASLLKSYHHQLETSLTLTPTSVTATKVITYYVGEKIGGSQQYSDKNKALFSTVPKKTGYVFTGWLGSDGKTYQPGATYTGSTGLKLTAQWKEGKSTVTFDATEGTVNTASKVVCVDSAYGELPTPARDYYTFLGWYTAQTGGSKVTSSTTVTKTEDHTLYAHWMNKTAYVKLDPNGGSPSSSVTMDAGTKLSDIPGFDDNPTRNNYTFAGWYTEKDGGTQVDGNTIISDSVTYYAHWTGTPSTVTLKYSDSTTADKTLNVDYGGTYSNLPAPARTNYTFDGWYTAESSGSKVTNSTTVTKTAAHTLYARWTRNVANIRFMDGDSTIASRTVNAGDELGALPQPAKTGYTFDGWYTSANGGNKIAADTKITETANYYAHWTAETYTVTFNKNNGTNGGSSSESKSLGYGSNYTLPEAPQRTGYTFLGWFTEASDGTKVTTGTAVSRAENHTLYAQWERVVYTVTFQNDSKTVETRRINAGEELGTLPAAAKTGYTLDGWYTSENGGNKVNNTDTISTDATYYAQWTANQYTITFNPNGGTVTDGTKTLEYDNELTLPADPTRTGYTFAGWYTAATGGNKISTSNSVPSANTTYYAHWTAKQYRVCFNYNGSNQGTLWRTISYGDTYGCTNSGKVVMISTEPKRDGYNFVGWYTAASGGTQVSVNTVMNRTENHTLYAHWETQHKHAVATDDAAVEFDQALTQSYINGLTSKTTSIGTATVNYITLPTGNYYLAEDITTDKSIWLAGNVNLCFNGHTITSAFSKNNSNVAALMPNGSCHFAACDCQGDGGFTCEDGYVLTTNKGTNCTVELYGGMFSGGWTTYVTNSNSLTVDGATIKATGIAINAQSNSKVTIKSGLVTSDISKLSNSDWAAMYVYSGVECKIEGGTITNTNKNCGYSISVGESCIKLSGSPIIKGTACDFNISSGNSKIEVADDLTGVYTVGLNGTVSKRSAWTMTTESNEDVTSHFVAKSSSLVLRDVEVNGKHTVQLYTHHKHDGTEWNYEVLNSKTELTSGVQYVLIENLTRDLITIPKDTTVDLCLNGKTLTGKIIVNGTLNLYSCKSGGGITNSGGSTIVVGSTGTLNYYGGKLTGGSGTNVPIYANGNVNLYATPTISTSCDYEIRGNSPGFLHICKALTTKPSSPLRVNFGDANSVNITNNKQVTVTSGWSAYMSGKIPTQYFAPRASRIAKIDTNEDGELVLRLLRVTIDGKTYYPAYDGGKITDLPDKPTKTGYIWQGYYTAETGGTKQEISSSTVFTDDMTLYSQWKECDHSANTNTIEKTAATCTTVGSEKYTCSVCGLAVENVIPALGHDYDSSTWTQDETRGTHYHACTRANCGTRIDEAEHTWETDTTTDATCTTDGSVKYSCTVCSATKTETIPALGHDYSNDWLNDDTNHWNKCSRSGCNGTTTAEAHSWGAWAVTQAAEVNKKGEQTSTCEVCGKTKTQEIGALPAPEPTKYTVTYQLDKYTGGNVPTQMATAKEGTFTLDSGTGLSRTGYSFAGWALLDENGVAGNNTLTGEFTMPERDVTFVVRWTRLESCDLESGDTIVLEDNSVVERSSDGRTVTINQGGTGGADTAITLPDSSSAVTVTNSGNKDGIVVPDGSTVRTGPTTVTISGGSGSVEITGAVNAPAGSSVTDKNGNQITMKSGSGRIDTDGTVSFSNGEGKVSVKDKSGNTTSIDVPAGSEGVTVTESGTPLVDDGSNGVTIVSADGTTTTITLPESADADAGIDETNNGVSVPAGSTITTTKNGATTTTTISEGTGNVASDGKVTLPDGGKVTIRDSEGKETTSTVQKGESVDLAHIHSWSVDWNKNDTHHWHDCTADNCPVKVASEKNGYAEHIYDKEVTTNEYLASAATCTEKAKYYKSCVCGAKGTETFESGEGISHTPAAAVKENEVAATCTTAGSYDEVVYCSACGTEISRTEKTIEMLGHNYSAEWTTDNEPTCTETGSKSRHCTRDGCNETIDATEIVALQHDYSVSQNNAVAATCTTAGKETDMKCSRCDDVQTGETINALGHSMSHRPEVMANCTTTGNMEYWYCSRCDKNFGDEAGTNELTTVTTAINASNHSGTLGDWQSDGSSHWKEYGCCHVKTAKADHNFSTWSGGKQTCGTCGYENTCNHTGGTATCREKAKCSICGEEYGYLADHEYGNLISEVPATHIEKGTKAHYTCSVCGENFDESKEELADLTIPKLTAHTYDKEVAEEKYLKTEANCTHAAVYYKSCECGATGTETFEDGSALDHSYEWQQDAEKHWKQCTHCNATDAEGNHIYDDDSDTACNTCGYGRTVAPVEHTHTLTKIDPVPASCTGEGVKEHWECSGCGKLFANENGTAEITDTTIPKLAHTWNTGEITTAPTTSSEGVNTYSCTACGATKTEAIAKLPSGGGSSGGGSTGGGSIILPSGSNDENVVNKAEDKTTGAAATTTATIKPSTVTTTTDGNKTTTATVDNTTATKIIEKAISNRSAEVVVDTATAKTVTETAAGSATEIALPEKAVQELSEKTEASVTIKSDAAEVTLNKAAVDGLAAQAGDDGYVRLVVEIVKQEPKRMEVELKLVTSKGTVTDFKGGDVSVTVKLNDTLAAAGLVCVYIDDYGTYHKVTGDKNADGTYNFITGHFSRYAIMALDDADRIIAEQTVKVKALAGKIQIKARSVKTAKGNIKVRLKITKGAASFKALEDMGYTLKYQFYRSTKMRKNYKAKFETLGKPYTNTDAKKGVRYYYKARIVVYDTEGNLITKTNLKKCWYATRIR